MIHLISTGDSKAKYSFTIVNKGRPVGGPHKQRAYKTKEAVYADLRALMSETNTNVFFCVQDDTKEGSPVYYVTNRAKNKSQVKPERSYSK